ncbi:hypothetical protein CLOP_g9291 [Closterium sp. NIES-67]|nr:hypothetical protein CLOP_g9291 [Closterium sp. NIES-67]
MPPSPFVPPPPDDLFGPDNDEYTRTTPFSTITPADIPAPPTPDYSAHDHSPLRGGPYGGAGGGFGRRGRGGRGRMGGPRQPSGPAFQVLPANNPNLASMAVLGLRGHHDAALKAAKLPTFQKPNLLAGFSRLGDGTVFWDERCLRRLRPAILGRDGVGGVGRDGAAASAAVGDSESGFADVLRAMRSVLKHQLAALQPGTSPDRLHFVTFRNNLNKLMGVCYNRQDAWEMGVHKRLGSVYLDVHKTAADQQQQQHKSEQQRRFEFYGYSFERVATEARKTGPGEAGAGGEDSPVIDANEEFCAVLKTKVGAHRVLMGAEMDCYEWVNMPQPSSGPPKPERIFLELKTSLLPETEGQRERFERDKLLKWWIQSFVGGVGAIVVGFRDTRGRLVGVERWSLGEVTRRVKGKDYWEAGSVLTFTDQVLTWLYGSAQEGGDYVLRFVPGQSRLELAAADGCPAFIEQHCQELAAIGIS